jgi:CRISPR-associated protein Cas1
VGFRTVVITKHCKCSYKNDYLVIRTDELKMIHLSEIDTVIFETPAVSITGVLLNELSQRRIGILFCNERHLPQGTFVPITGNYISAGRIMAQAAWDNASKDIVWKEIVKHKIDKQASLLEHHKHFEEAMLLRSYIDQVEEGDSTNREGFAAKVFFNALFGSDFARSDLSRNSECNACLDYGYSVLLAMVAKEVSAAGYELALGIHHRGTTNPYNLACDVMEPFRPIVDNIVVKAFDGVLSQEMKQCFWGLGNIEVYYGGIKSYLASSIGGYARDICRCMNEGGGLPMIYDCVW